MSRETPLVYLGVDPGLCITGYGVLRFDPEAELLDAGTIRSRPSDPLPVRLSELYRGLAEVIEAFHPDVIGLEEVFSHYRHPSTAIAMAHARGVLCLAGAERSLRFVSLPPAVIKKLITGNGRAGKEQVAGMVCRLLGIREPISPPDVTDALAIAMAAHESERHVREHPGNHRDR